MATNTQLSAESLSHQTRRKNSKIGFGIFNWCVTFRIEALVGSLAIDIADVLELMPDSKRIAEEKGNGIDAPKFYSKQSTCFGT